MKVTGDLIGKIIVILIIAVLAVFCGINMTRSNSSAQSMGGMPGAGQMGGAPTGGMPNANAQGGNAGQSNASAQAGGMPNAQGGNAGQSNASAQAGGAPTGGMPSAQAGGTQTTTAAANTVTVSAKVMQGETIQSTVKVNGDVSSKTEVNAYPDTSGKVSSVLKTIGDTVRKGEVIAYVDPSRAGATYSVNPVTSPVAGTIIDMSIAVGDTVSTNTVIASIGSVTDLQITVNVSEKYSSYLQTGLPAYLTLTSAPDEKFNAHISSISPVVNSSNRTVKVTLSLDKYDSRIKPGMFASVDLVIRQSDNTFVVPKDAIKDYNDKDTVFIIDENNCAKRVEVTTGISTDLLIEITSGVEKGQTVITAGSVTEGNPVRIAGSDK